MTDTPARRPAKTSVVLSPIMKQHVQTDLDADRAVASTLADLIFGGLLATSEIAGQGAKADAE